MEAKEFYKYTKWCWENDIYIVPQPINPNGSICKILLLNKGKQKIGEEKYTNEKVYDKIKDLYKKIFIKNNPQIINQKTNNHV
jgi:hypothetical protein